MGKTKNPHAFPVAAQFEDGEFVCEFGMTLRDYFAAHVTVTDNDYETYCRTWSDLCGTNGFDPATEAPSRDAALVRAAFEAKIRYIKADAMLKAREVSNG